MPLPDFTSPQTFPAFSTLPFTTTTPSSAPQLTSQDPTPENSEGRNEPYYLLATITQNMTLTKPTLILTDASPSQSQTTGSTFALVFDSRPGSGPGTLDLRGMGLRVGATLVLRGARRTPSKARAADGEGEGVGGEGGGSGGGQGFISVSREMEGDVKVIPAGLDGVRRVGGWLRERDLKGKQRGCECCGGGKEGKLMRCTGCGEAEYCSKECQVKHWNSGHKADCKVIKAIRTIWP